MPKKNSNIDRQRDMGSGMDAGTDVNAGADPHVGAGTGTHLDTGQYRGSDEGTSTEPGTGPAGMNQTRNPNPGTRIGTDSPDDNAVRDNAIGTGDYAHQEQDNDLGTDQYTNSGSGRVADTTTDSGAN